MLLPPLALRATAVKSLTRATGPGCVARLSTHRRENIPHYRNSDLSYVSRIPAHSRGAIMRSSLSRAGLAVDAAASGANSQGQGGLLSVSPKASCGRTALSGSSRHTSMATCTTPSDPVANKRTARTAKPCGPGRRCYDQAGAHIVAPCRPGSRLCAATLRALQPVRDTDALVPRAIDRHGSAAASSANLRGCGGKRRRTPLRRL